MQCVFDMKIHRESAARADEDGFDLEPLTGGNVDDIEARLAESLVMAGYARADVTGRDS